MKNFSPRVILYTAWIISLSATLSSLYASEILHLPPCVLCWYQRIMMYPLAIFMPIGIILKDKLLPFYVVPLSGIGVMIAFYHYLLQKGIIPDALAPCTLGISCTTRYIEWFGFITIPFLSLISFVVILACMIWFIKITKTYGK